MHVLLYVCVYAGTFRCIYVHICLCMYVRMWTSGTKSRIVMMYVLQYVCMGAGTYGCMYMDVFVQYVCVHVCVFKYVSSVCLPVYVDTYTQSKYMNMNILIYNEEKLFGTISYIYLRVYIRTHAYIYTKKQQTKRIVCIHTWKVDTHIT